MIKIETNQLQEGAILAQPVITPLGQLLAPAGSAVTRQLINRMKLYRVEYAEIEGEEPAPQEEAPKPVKEAKTYAQESKTHSKKQYKLFRKRLSNNFKDKCDSCYSKIKREK